MTAKEFKLTIVLTIFFSLVFVQAGLADTVCFKCHERSSFSGTVVHKPVAKGQCSVCHNPHVARFAGLLQQETGDLCYSCHKDKIGIFQQGVVHEPVRQGKCTACHAPHASNGKGLINGRLADRCFGCHDSLTKSYKVNHQPYVKGQCSACHLPHRADNYQLLRKDADDMCFSCHQRQNLGQAHKNYPADLKGCLSCHSPHGSSRRALVRDLLHEPYKDGCADCHRGGKSVDVDICLECHEDVAAQALNSHSHLTDRSGNSCINCHSPHAGDSVGLLKGRQVQICRSCHEDTYIRYGDREFLHEQTMRDCSQCHVAHGSSQLPMLKADGIGICTECHKDHSKFTHPVGQLVLDPRNGQMMTCLSCHNPHGTDYEFNMRLDGGGDMCRQCHKGYEGLGE